MNAFVRRLAGSLVKHVTLDLGVMSLNPTLSEEPTSKKINKILKMDK